MQRTVIFSPDCAYDSAAYNADDVNKLFGPSFGLGGVHKNSARFGWRWSKADQCIELLAYVYVNGERQHDEQLRYPVVGQVKPGVAVRCLIEYDADEPSYLFAVHSEGGGFYGCEAVRIPGAPPKFGLTHGLYWGGETLCPHDMSVVINRV